MKCENCGFENKKDASFCTKCGSAIKHKKSIVNIISKEKSSNDDTTKYIIIALIIIVIVLAGVFAFVVFGNNDDGVNQIQNNGQTSNSTNAQSSQVSSTNAVQDMTIYGGSFSTGSSLSDKTYASIYVGSQHSGEKVKIQIKYFRDGYSLNNGNMVSKTVDSSGYINVRSADSYNYYPDFAEINIYDTSGNLLDSHSVSLIPESGTQSF